MRYFPLDVLNTQEIPGGGVRGIPLQKGVPEGDSPPT